MDIQDLEKILAVLKENGVTEFELNQGETHIKLSRAHGLRPSEGAGLPPQLHMDATSTPLTHSGPPAIDDHEAGMVRVESPIVGTFYGKPSPDADTFVQSGSTVKKGDTLCIIEAMKLMNEIEAEIDGVITEILVTNEDPVEYGQPLFRIRPA